MTCPSDILPSRNFGAQSKSARPAQRGSTPATPKRCACAGLSAAPIAEDMAEVAVDAAPLLFLAAEQCDALAVFPHPGQRVTEFGFRLVLFLGEVDEMAANDHHRGGGDRGIDDRGNDEEAGNGEARTSIDRVSAPPIVQRTTIKVGADKKAERTPAMKSTGDPWQSANPPRCGLRDSGGRH